MSNQTTLLSYPNEFSGNASYDVESIVKFIRENMKPTDRGLISVSGGVDSSTVAVLVDKAMPNSSDMVFIDTGFMRFINGEKESEVVRRTLKNFLPRLEILDESNLFKRNIFGKEDANEKRVDGFRDTYDFVLNRIAQERGCNVHYDGTIFLDVKETLDGLKPQSNVGNKFNFEKKIELFRPFYKSQVRQISEAVGLPEEVSKRQPFPGPGNSIRTVGTTDEEKLNVQKIANDLVEQGIEKYFTDLYGKPFLYDQRSGERIPFQYFAVTLDDIIEEGTDLENEVKEYVSKLVGKDVMVDVLRNKATGVKVTPDNHYNRVFAPVVKLDIDGEVDSFVLAHLGRTIPERYGFSRVINTLSKSTSADSSYVVAIRNVKSAGFPAESIIELPIYSNIAHNIRQQCPSVGEVCIDISSKPPATIEYE